MSGSRAPDVLQGIVTETTSTILSGLGTIVVEDYQGREGKAEVDSSVAIVIKAIEPEEKKPESIPEKTAPERMAIKTKKLSDFNFKPKGAPVSTSYFSSFARIPLIGNLFQTPSVAENALPSFHETEDIAKKGHTEFDHIFKHNPKENIFTTYEYMPQIEAAMSRIFRMLGGRDKIAKSTAVYDVDKQQYSGVAVKRLKDFVEARKDKIPENYLSNFETVKRFTMGHFFALFMGSDDGHPGNFSLFGHHIDFDMLMWRVTCLFKGNYYLNTYRKPNAKTFHITTKGLATFPIIEKECAPSIWLTEPAGIVSESVRKGMESWVPLSKNSFKKEDNEFYKKMAETPAAQIGACTALLKIILTDRQMYRNLFSLELNESDKLAGYDINVIDMYANEFENQLKVYKDVAICSSDFEKFLKTHGQNAYDEIFKEFQDYNQHLVDKFNKHLKKQKELEDKLAKTLQNYQSKMTEFTKTSPSQFEISSRNLIKEFDAEKQKLEQELNDQIYHVRAIEKEMELSTVDLKKIRERYLDIRKDIIVNLMTDELEKELENAKSSASDNNTFQTPKL